GGLLQRDRVRDLLEGGADLDDLTMLGGRGAQVDRSDERRSVEDLQLPTGGAGGHHDREMAVRGGDREIWASRVKTPLAGRLRGSRERAVASRGKVRLRASRSPLGPVPAPSPARRRWCRRCG